LDSGGKGAPVILLHAAGGTSESFENQFSAFAAEGYRVIAYDRRGFGRTTFEAGAEPGRLAGDLAAFLDFLGLDAVDLVGTATGGIVALDFALS
jgi:non-heme chloroperoxidase